MHIKFIINIKKQKLEAWLDGKRIHMVLSKPHLEEIKQVSNMAYLEDFLGYCNYLNLQRYWDVDLIGKEYEVIYLENNLTVADK